MHSADCMAELNRANSRGGHLPAHYIAELKGANSRGGHIPQSIHYIINSRVERGKIAELIALVSRERLPMFYSVPTVPSSSEPRVQEVGKG